ncbi:hypothetical protein [Mucilaginibacter auburnensis]|uniref:Uncharacterized protein n=1 Tax=Mucilaginibacter auburnensis TaxID=1457233 RepID=A0A2H9VQ14_9SPHI|nr:hypothetical protein [Mucilaginibacter auburnensis]PJJ80415.1 hypothetical protein CLV57_3566 [Mucilaginibacter auburnensis]
MPKNCLHYIVILFALILVNACQFSEDKVNYLPTKHIDTNVYNKLYKQFNVGHIFKAHNYLGNLKPNYPVAFTSQLLFDPKGKPVSRDTDWVQGGFFPSARKVIVKTDTGYVMLNNRQEVKKFYAPISSQEEALAYATLYNLAFAAFEDFFNAKSFRYVGEKPKASYAKEKNGAYEVHLFSYKAFGCDHPYFSEIYEVRQDGSVRLVSRQRSFTNPKDDGLCVD